MTHSNEQRAITANPSAVHNLQDGIRLRSGGHCNTVENIYEAPKELQALAEQVELVETTLESVGELPRSEAAKTVRDFINAKIGLWEYWKRCVTS